MVSCQTKYRKMVKTCCGSLCKRQIMKIVQRMWVGVGLYSVVGKTIEN